MGNLQRAWPDFWVRVQDMEASETAKAAKAARWRNIRRRFGANIGRRESTNNIKPMTFNQANRTRHRV
jgi:hypothetical protein